MRLIDEITCFLEGCGFECSRQVHDNFEFICTSRLISKESMLILPQEVSALSAHEAVRFSEETYRCIRSIAEKNRYPVIITEDRWNSQGDMMKARLMAHLEVFDQIYARNCEIRKIDKNTASEFLKVNHSYGDASCRYRYGLFLKRHTGHIAKEGIEIERYKPGDLIAVATFSNGRKWIKGDKEIRSYEWTRYASVPGVRISGGMGKVLKAFVKDVKPDDIMSYADLEWSEGDAYEQLGFTLEGVKNPVIFKISTADWLRNAATGTYDESHLSEESLKGSRYFCNFGSNKYRLKLTDYK